MVERMYKKGLVLGIILLFIGVGAQPAFANILENNPPNTPTIYGPNNGNSDIDYVFIFILTDNDGDEMWLFIDWDDGTFVEWWGPFEDGEEIVVNHSWSENGTYTIGAKAKDFFDESGWAWHEIKIGNEPPEAPTINGPTTGQPGVEYDFIFNSVDLDGDDVSYFIDWGDGTSYGWTNYNPSGTDVTVSHTWEEIDWDNFVRAKAKDIFGFESDWSNQEMPILKSKANVKSTSDEEMFISNPIMENHPPYAPMIRGKSLIFVPGTYDYKFKAIDPDGDNVRYLIDWGDSPDKEWTDYYASGEEIIVSHTWNNKCKVQLRARANDTHGALGPWGTLPFPPPGRNLYSTEYKNEVKQETTIRIYRANGITPYTVKLTEKESNEIDRIFDNLKVSLDSAETGEEIDEIYDDAVVSLYELGMFPRMSVEEAQQLVKVESQNPSVRSLSGNLNPADENFNCQIAGQTSETFMFDLDKPFWDKWLNILRYRFWIGTELGWYHLNLRRYIGKIGQISFCYFQRWDIDDYEYTPSEGWVWTNGSNGVQK